MEVFRTLVSVPGVRKKISLRTPIMLLGSCFSEYIGNKLGESKFILDNNPFGIVYNPLSISYQLTYLLNGNDYTLQDLFLNEGVWCSFDHHSRFAENDAKSTLAKINDRLHKSREFIHSTHTLFLTFGTSYVYFLKNTGKVVSNCHKVPAREFDRRRINVEEIVSEYKLLIPPLTSVNPDLQIIFTVSPIRHWKDGPHENQLSKSVLLLAIEEICNLYPNTFYFPSYEIMMDDLRDYRFYTEDMLHPNSTAVNYIWDKFKECFLGSDTLAVMKEVEKVVQAAKHRPFNTETEAFQSFARQQYNKIQYLKEQYSISLDNEEAHFKSLMYPNIS